MRSLPEYCCEPECKRMISTQENCWVFDGRECVLKRCSEVTFRESVTKDIHCHEHLPWRKGRS